MVQIRQKDNILLQTTIACQKLKTDDKVKADNKDLEM